MVGLGFQTRHQASNLAKDVLSPLEYGLWRHLLSRTTGGEVVLSAVVGPACLSRKLLVSTLVPPFPFPAHRLEPLYPRSDCSS